MEWRLSVEFKFNEFEESLKGCCLSSKFWAKILGLLFHFGIQNSNSDSQKDEPFKVSLEQTKEGSLHLDKALLKAKALFLLQVYYQKFLGPN